MHNTYILLYISIVIRSFHLLIFFIQIDVVWNDLTKYLCFWMLLGALFCLFHCFCCCSIWLNQNLESNNISFKILVFLFAFCFFLSNICVFLLILDIREISRKFTLDLYFLISCCKRINWIDSLLFERQHSAIINIRVSLNLCAGIDTYKILLRSTKL